MAHTITLLPGDGIGPEVIEAALHVLEATGVAFEWERHDVVGLSALARFATPLPRAVLESIRRNKVALKGPITTPVGTGFRSVNVRLRQLLDLFASVRPCKSLPGVSSRFDNVDLVIIRENTEGLYSGIENYDERLEIADSIARVTRRGSQRIIRYAFEYARSHGRKMVTLVHKANILKATTGMFLDEGKALAPNYPGIIFNHRIIDNMAMQLVMAPEEYDCIVTTNLFGDILSDLCAGLVGGLGMVSSANIGDDVALFEAVHGSAPDIVGLGKANPTAVLRSAVMMMRHLGEYSAARNIEQAITEAFKAGTCLTADVGGASSTQEFATALAQRVSELSAT